MATNKWVPLPKIAHGTAITSFTPTHIHANATTSSSHSRPTTIYSSTYFSSSADSSLTNVSRPPTAPSDVSTSTSNDYAYLLPLEVGDDLYIFEQNGDWYRGYVLGSLEEGKKPNLAPNGIFPKSHVQIKEYVNLDWSVNEQFVKQGSTATSSTQSATNTTVNSNLMARSSFNGFDYGDTPPLLAPTYITVNSNPMARSSLNGFDYDDTPPLLAPTSIPSETIPPPVANSSHPTGDSNFDNSLSSTSDDLQTQHQQRIQSKSMTMDSGQELQQSKRPSPPPLPMERFDQSTLTGADEPLVDEIAACASEWNCLLYTYLQEKQYGAFNAARDHINYLFQARRQLLDQALSSEELSRLRKDIIQRMVTMNISHHREMIIRHPEHGFILDINNTSAATLYYMHWKYTISDQIPLKTLFPQSYLHDVDDSQNLSSSNPSTSSDAPGVALGSMSSPLKNSTHKRHTTRRKPFYHYKGGEFHHLFFDLKAFVAHICQPGEWTELRFSLYSDNIGKFVTESFVVHLNYNGMPKDESQTGKFQTLFTDLAYQDLNEHLYLVCHIFRLGGMRFVDKQREHMGILGQHTPTLFGGHHHNKNRSRFGPIGNGGGYFDHTNRHNRNQQPSAYPNESTSLPSSAHTNLFRRPFGCAVLNIGRCLHQIDPANATTNTNLSNSNVSQSWQQRPYMSTEMMRSPTLSSATHHSPTGIDMTSPTLGSSSTAPFIPLSSGSSTSGSSSSASGGNYVGHYYLLPSEHDMRIYSPSSESDFAHIHEDIIRENTKELIQNNRAETLCVNLRMFFGQQGEVLMTNAALLQGIPLTARIGFPDVVFPDNDRNELYITLNSGDFAQFGRTRNIQVIICARDNYTGDVVEMAVAVGSGTPRTSTWESAIYYHEMKPTWNEMVKVKINDVQIWQRSHVFLVVKHRSRHGGGASSLYNGGNDTASGRSRSTRTATTAPALTRLTSEGNTSSSDKILAVGYIPLFIPPLSHDFVADGTHTLCLYKYDRQLLHPSSYFGVVPWCSHTTAPINMESQENMLATVRQAYRQISAKRQHSNSSHGSSRQGNNGLSAKDHTDTHRNFFSALGLQHQCPLNSVESSLGSESGSGTNVYYGGGTNARLHASRDSLVVSTFLCSTQFTQNTALVKLINWRSIVRQDDDNIMTAGDESADELLAILDKFTFVGEREVVKFLADVFDALLDILVFRVPGFPEKQNALHDQVIVAITWILSIVQDRRFSNFRPVLNVYINQRFYCSDDCEDDNSFAHVDDGLYSSSANHTDEMINNMNLYGVPVRRQQEGNASLMDSANPIFKRDADTTGTYQLYTSYRYRLKHNKKLRQKMTLTETTYNQLLQGLIRLSTNPSDTNKAKRLRSSIKGWEYLFLFIKRSRDMHRTNEDRGQHELREQMYKRDLQRFFGLAIDMMRPDQPSSMIGTQTLVLQHFCEAITEVRNAYSSKEIVDIVSTLVDACSHVTGKLVGFKLTMILSIIKAPIFSDKTCCFELGKLVIGWIKVWLNSYMVAAKDVIFARTMENSGRKQDDIQQQTRLPRAQWLENLRISLTIVHEILEKIRKVRGMSLSGLSLVYMSSPTIPSTTTPASTTTTPRTRPTSVSTLGDDDFDSIISDVYDETSPDYVTSGSPLDTLTEMLICLVPQLLQAYKDLQRLTTQAIQATASSSDNTTKSVPTPVNIPLANRNTVNSVPLSSNSSDPTAASHNARHSLAALRERAGSMRDLPQVPESSMVANMTVADQSKTVTSGSVPMVVQALATSPTTPFPSLYPFQANTTNEAAVTAGADLATMVTSGLLDLTVVLLDLFHLTPPNQWLYILQKMGANKDGSSGYGNGGPVMTADYICTLCYVCMAILFGDDVYKLAETHGTVEGYDTFMEDPTRDRRKWPKNWLNLDVVAYKIILRNILAPVVELLKMDDFTPIQNGQNQGCNGQKASTKDIGDGESQSDAMVRLWRVVFMTAVRALASPSLEVETLLPQAQRAVWKLAGNIRGDEGTGILTRLWHLTGSRRRLSHLPKENIRQRQESKDLKMKPRLLDYFDHHHQNSVYEVDGYGDDNAEGESMLGTPENGAENGEYVASSVLNEESTVSSYEDVIQIHLESMPVLLRPLCAASLTLHDKLRFTTVGFIADLLAIYIPKTNDAITGQNLMIGTIDKLVMTNGKGSDEIMVKWVAELQQSFHLRLTTESERAWGRSVVDSISNLMELLLQIRSLPIDSAEFMDERINATLKLMKFIKVCERQEIYIKYVHQLVDLHLHNKNFIEAALTLRFHADLLQWDPYDEVDAIPELGYTMESSFARKKGLYETMIAYLDKGTAWELCIDLCQEIGDQYALTVVNYPLCGGVLRQKADFMDKIVTKERYYSEYFRVGFYGRGFPASIRNQHFIYRGMAWEKMSSFVERMQNRHPNAQLVSGKLTTGALLRDDQIRELETELDGQYMQITAVTPVMNPLANPILTNSLTSDKIKKYYQFNKVSQFTYSRPVTREEDDDDSDGVETSNGNNDFIGKTGEGECDGNGDKRNNSVGMISKDNTPILTKQELDFLHLWTERTTFTSEDTFPTITLRSKIVSIEVNEISPIQNAVEAMNNKTNELITLEKNYSAYLTNPNIPYNLNPFSMALNGAVDAPVNGGVALYKKTFLSPYFVKKHPDMSGWVDQLKAAIDEQVIVIDRCLDTHGKLVSSPMRPFHDNMIKLYKKNFMDNIDQLRRRGTSLKATLSMTTEKGKRIYQSTTSNKNDSRKGSVPQSGRRNLNASTSHPSLPTSAQYNRPGSTFFRDMDYPLLMKSRTSSASSQQQQHLASPSNTSQSTLMSPKSTNRFSIPNLREQQSPKFYSSDGLQKTSSFSSATSGEMTNSNTIDHNQQNRHHGNSNASALSAPSSFMHPNEQAYFEQNEGKVRTSGLSKSLKQSLRRVRKRTTSSGGTDK